MTERPKKVFVLGSGRLAGVDSADWFDELPNLADYDAVVVSTASLDASLRELRDIIPAAARTDEAPIKKRVDDVTKRLKYVRDRLVLVLRTYGTVVAILQKREVSSYEIGQRSGWLANDAWYPIPITTFSEPGDTLEGEHAGLSGYFSKVKRWTHVFSREVDLDAKGEELRYEAHAYDRQGNPVGISLVIGRWVDVYQSEPEWEAVSGKFICLVPPTECDEGAAVTILLQDLFGVKTSVPAPSWVDQTRVPGENKARRELEEAQSELASAGTAFQEAEARLASVREPVRILYQQHHVLQAACEDVFQRIGIQTKPSEVSDEFMLEFCGREVLVEVKGSGKSLKMRDLRQLLNYVVSYAELFEKPIKGLVVVNVWIGSPPGEREPPDKPPFPGNVIEQAEQHRIALLDTRELFKAYTDVQEGRLTAEEVFDKLATTDGVVTFEGGSQ